MNRRESAMIIQDPQVITKKKMTAGLLNRVVPQLDKMQ
eukprot:SAG11_NODE_15092_length_589_cov_1.261224_1_plen_37_part_10